MDVAVHRVDLDDVRLASKDRIDWLDADERRRLAGFIRRRDAMRFAAAHSALREVLGDALACPPHAVAFERGPWGRPALRDACIDFSLTHADHVGLIAVSVGGRVGIDAELATRAIDLRTVEVFATASERRRLAGAAEHRRAALRLWAAKEAVLKAGGRGLSAEPQAIVAALGDRDGLAIDLVTKPRFWRLASLAAGSDLIAVLATPPHARIIGEQVIVRRYEPSAGRAPGFVVASARRQC